MSSFTSYELILACRQPGCAACRLEQRSVERYLHSQLYENVNTRELRDWLRASLGFCHEHAWLAVDKNLGDALGFAIIYHDVIGATLKRLEKRLAPPSGQGWAAALKRIPEQMVDKVQSVISALKPHKRCPICHEREAITRMIVTGLVRELGEPGMVEALNRSDGLCLPHLRLALEEAQDAESSGKLISIHHSKLEKLHGELAELIRKNDHRFIAAGFGAEGDSWRRAIGMVAGASGRN